MRAPSRHGAALLECRIKERLGGLLLFNPEPQGQRGLLPLCTPKANQRWLSQRGAP